MKENFKKEDVLREEIARLEEENRELSFQFQKTNKLNESIGRTVHIAKSFSYAIFVGLVAFHTDN